MARCMHSYYPTTHTHPLCSNQRMYWAVSAQLFCISQFMLKIIFILYAQSNNNFGFCSNSMLHRNMCTFMNVVFLAVVVAVVDCWLLVCARVYKYNIIILEKYKCYLAKIMFYYDYYCEILVGWHRMLMKRAKRMGTAENTESMRMNFHSFRTWMNVGYCSDAEQCLCISTPSWKVRTSWRFVLCVDCEVEYVYEVDIVESKNPFFLYSKGTACDDITYESESGEWNNINPP